MDIQQLRHALKVKWLLYYRQNRPWLTKLRIWETYEGKRRPSSNFILATLPNLEPQLVQMLPFIVSLSNNPDQIVVALGLNFNPEEELQLLTDAAFMAEANKQNHANGNGLLLASGVEPNSSNGNGLALASGVEPNRSNGNGLPKQALPEIKNEVASSSVTQASNIPSWLDESCRGIGWDRD